MRQKQTDRHRKTETDRDRQRQTETGRHRLRQKQTDCDKNRQSETETETEAETETARDRQTDRKRGGQPVDTLGPRHAVETHLESVLSVLEGRLGEVHLYGEILVLLHQVVALLVVTCQTSDETLRQAISVRSGSVIKLKDTVQLQHAL